MDTIRNVREVLVIQTKMDRILPLPFLILLLLLLSVVPLLFQFVVDIALRNNDLSSHMYYV